MMQLLGTGVWVRRELGARCIVCSVACSRVLKRMTGGEGALCKKPWEQPRNAAARVLSVRVPSRQRGRCRAAREHACAVVGDEELGWSRQGNW